ncbi:MAG: hypothetical protein FWD49_04800 [Firmicutes bacterium]|nr:hypothetical protein [Bacillota bacterium]
MKTKIKTIKYTENDLKHKYTGEVKDGKPHGKGVLEYEVLCKGVTESNDSFWYKKWVKYEGNFEDGKMHGEGVITYQDGTTHNCP